MKNGIAKRGSTYSYVVRIPDPKTGKTKPHWVSGFKTELVAKNLGVEKLHRADADFVKSSSGISIGGVSPIGWEPSTGINLPIIVIDKSLDAFEVVWAAAGHAHAVFPTTYSELLEQTKAIPMAVGE
jgi:prolyl-tRNA editing enzyme YbaK/EbsC (Cys-tRNA(Pro) deacylase)